jgi:hypothetical protein
VRPAPGLRRHLPFLIILAGGIGLRLWGLSWLPSPAGDEGNWTLYAFRIRNGLPTALEKDAAFVSLLFAHLIAAIMTVLGPSFFAARLVSALAALLTVVAGYVVPSKLGSLRAGLVTAMFLAVHPWTVLYGRIASVPYTLALLVVTAGPLLFVAGLRRRRIVLAAAGIQVLALGAHFSPLTVIAPLACALFALRAEHRWVFAHWLTYASAIVGVLHALPVVLSASRIAQAAALVDEPGSFWPRLGGFLHMVLTGLGGEATLRHFTNAALPPWPALVVALPVLAFGALSFTTAARRDGVLGGFAPFYLAVALLVMPLVLAPGRNWYLPANHMDRYLFAVLAPFALCVGEVAATWTRGRRLLVVGYLGWLLVGCTGRAAYAYLGQGGVDHGELIFDGGGGYRGWLVSEEPRATVVQVRETVLREVGHGGAAILVADRVFIPLELVLMGSGLAVHDVRRTTIPPRPDGRYFVLVWPEGVLSVGNPPTANPKYVASNRRLRERMHRLFHRVRLVKTLRQRDGSPLLEIWRAEQPVPRLVDPSLRRKAARPDEIVDDPGDAGEVE